jgi:hypothetical protein
LDERDATKRTERTAPPPAAPRVLTLPPKAAAWEEAFYGSASPKRRADVHRQLLATLNGGARLAAGASPVYARSPERLDEKCGQMIHAGVAALDDPDKAIRVLLLKLGDESGKDSATERASAEQRRDRFADMVPENRERKVARLERIDGLVAGEMNRVEQLGKGSAR